jgi:hypothetical protein
VEPSQSHGFSRDGGAAICKLREARRRPDIRKLALSASKRADAFDQRGQRNPVGVETLTVAEKISASPRAESPPPRSVLRWCSVANFDAELRAADRADSSPRDWALAAFRAAVHRCRARHTQSLG